jgi:hypothetical protein
VIVAHLAPCGHPDHTLPPCALAPGTTGQLGFPPQHTGVMGEAASAAAGSPSQQQLDVRLLTWRAAVLTVRRNIVSCGMAS